MPHRGTLIPSVHSSLFEGEEESAALAIGVLAVGDAVVPGLEDEYRAYSLLRGRVYLEEHFTTDDRLNPDGSETDPDDCRSIHFGVIENDRSNERHRMIGTMRLIAKSDAADAPLPVEHHFPEIFKDAPAPPLSAEVSRLICVHEHATLQNFCKWPLFTAALTYTTAHNLAPIYAVVTERFRRILRHFGVPLSAIAEPRYIPEINATKQPTVVDTGALRASITRDDTRTRVFSDLQEAIATRFVYLLPQDLP
jgi:N-acyl-L-homoserine lactone synthetase